MTIDGSHDRVEREFPSDCGLCGINSKFRFSALRCELWGPKQRTSLSRKTGDGMVIAQGGKTGFGPLASTCPVLLTYC